MRKLRKFFKNPFSRRKGKAKKAKADLKAGENSPIAAQRAAVEDKVLMKQGAPKEAGAEDPMRTAITQEKRHALINDEMKTSTGERTCANTNFVTDDLGKGQAIKLDDRNKPSLNQRDELLKYNLQTTTTTENKEATEAKAKDYFQSIYPQKIHDFCNLGEICDLEIHIDKDVFLTTRHALSCFSSYFSDLFPKKTKHEERNVYKMTGVSPETFLVFLEFANKREFNVHIDNLAEVIQLAYELRIPVLKERCLEKAVQSLLHNRCPPNSWLFGFLVSHLVKEFPLAKNIDGFYELDVSIICQILSNDDLQTASEMAVFKVALSWINNAMPDRDHYLGRVMRSIRFPYMTQKELRECCDITNVLKECSELLQKECSEIRENILLADWVITAKRLEVEDPFNISIPAARNCYGDKQQVEKKSSVYFVEKSSFVQANQQRLKRF